MKVLKDVTVSLKAVDQRTINRLFGLAVQEGKEFDIFVTENGYDLVPDEGPMLSVPVFDGPISQTQVDAIRDANKNDYAVNFPMRTNGIPATLPGSFADELRALINKHSLEGESDTPDYILASYVCDALSAFSNAANARRRHFTS